MIRKPTARRFFSILLSSRLALFAFGASALGLPIGLLPVSSAIAEEPAKQRPRSEHRKTAADRAEVDPITWVNVLPYFGLGVLFVGTAIPLILQSVPPNPWYGVRVQATLENPAVWYPANRYLGKCLLWFGLFMMASSYGLSFIPRINFFVYFMLCVGALLVGSHVLLIVTFLYLQSFSPSRVTHRDISAE
jgi:SdpI/YfhL protein family